LAEAPPFRACVLVPVYDNGGTVGAVVKGARALGLDVLVVDDGSRDGSGERAREEGATVVRHDANRGKGAALKTGFREALARGYTHAAAIDADGQHFPDDLPRLIEVARANPTALVIGAREFAGQTNVQTKSSFGRAFSNFWVWAETGVDVSDSQCGLRVYPVALVSQLPLRRDRFDFEVEVIVRAAWAGLPVLSEPIKVYYPPPEERISHFDLWRDNVRISLLNTRLVARRLLPWPHRRLIPRPRVGIRDRLRDLVRESSTPVGLGFAVGVGCIAGTSPFFGLQTLLAILFATLFRLNKAAAVLGSFVTTPPLTVPIVVASIWVGQLLLHGSARPIPDALPPLEVVVNEWFVEWLVGGLVVGAGLGVAIGGATGLIVARARRAAA
jgi:uncharacterized protein (DUF2062 family)